MNLRDVLRKSLIFFSFLVPLIPFVVADQLYFPFISGKGFAFRFIVLTIGVLWCLLAIIEPKYRFRSSQIFVAIIFFVGVIAAADFFGADPYKSFWSNFERMEGLITLLHLCVFFVVTGSVFSEKEWRAFFYTSIGAAFALSLYGIFQYFGALSIHQGNLRPDASFGNATYFAGYMLMHIFLAIFLSIHSSVKKWIRFSFITLSAVFSVALILTGTRGAVMALAVGLFILAIYGAMRLSGKKRIIAFCAVFLILTSPLAVMSMRHYSFVENNALLNRIASASFSGDDMQARFTIWKMALKGIKDRPILGWGQEGFNYVFNKYYDPKLLGREEWFDRTHNIFLDWAISGGILGFIGYLSLFAAALLLVRKKFNGWERIILYIFFIAYAAHNFFVFDNLISYILFFSLLAYIHGNYTQAQKSDNNSDGIKKPEVWKLILSSTFLAIIFLLIVWYSIILPVRAGRSLLKAMNFQSPQSIADSIPFFEKALIPRTFAQQESRERLTLFAAALPMSAAFNLMPQSAVQNIFVMAGKEIDAEIRRIPQDARFRYIAGALLIPYGLYENARQQFLSALELSPNKPQIMRAVGMALSGEKKYEESSKYFEKALSLAPRQYDYETIMEYAAAAIRGRNLKLSDDLLKRISGYRIVKDDRITVAYFDSGQIQEFFGRLDQVINRDPKSPDSDMAFFAGRAALATNDRALAARYFKLAIKGDKNYRALIENYLKNVGVVINI